MDVIINNANPGTPVQVIPQQAVPTTYGAPYGYGPVDRDHGGFSGGFLGLLVIGAVVFFRSRRRGWRDDRGGMGGNRTAPGSLGDEVRDTFRRGRARFVNDGALDIARERYAKGEINAEEYETLRRTLSGEAPRPAAGGDDGTLKL